MATYLDNILAWHHARAAADDRDVARLKADAAASGDPRDFAGALRPAGARRAALGADGDLPTVIAEVKRRSPSKGDIAADLDPGTVAAEYERGGAACLSVLTDERFFGGSTGDLVAARAATSLPVLRKDFTVCEADVCDAKLMGADCVLLIAAALGDELLARLVALAGYLGMHSLVEVHDEPEADRAVGVGASLVGVNQRDLTTFEVDPARAEKVAARLPGDVVKVAESGIASHEAVKALGSAGYDAVLVGEALVASADREGAVRRLRGLAPPAQAPGLRLAPAAGRPIR